MGRGKQTKKKQEKKQKQEKQNKNQNKHKGKDKQEQYIPYAQDIQKIQPKINKNELNESNVNKITQFVKITKSSADQAKIYLQQNNFNLDSAINSFLDSNQNELVQNKQNMKQANIDIQIDESQNMNVQQNIPQKAEVIEKWQDIKDLTNKQIKILDKFIEITELPIEEAKTKLNQSKYNLDEACDKFFDKESQKDQQHENKDNKSKQIHITVENSSDTKPSINIEFNETRGLTQVKGFFGIKKEFVQEKYQTQYLCEPEIPKTDEKPKQTEKNNEENTVNEPQKIENIIESQNPEIQQSPKRNQNSNNNYQNNNYNRSSNQNNQSNKPLQVNNRPSQDIMEQLLPQGPEFEHLFEQNNQQLQHQEQQPYYTNQYANHSVAQNQFSPQVPYINSRPMSQVPYQNTQQNNFNNYQYNQAQFVAPVTQYQQVQNYNRFVQPAFQPNQQVNQRFQQNQVVNYSQQLNSQFNPQNQQIQQSSIPQYRFAPQQPSNQPFIPQQSFNPAIQSPNVQQRQFNPTQLSQPFNSPLQNQNQMFQQQFQNNQFNYNQFQTNSINQNVQIPFQQSPQQVQSAQQFNLPGNEIPTLNLSQKQE
ncbi:UBA-like_superfamily [Hexamita inflata]|uniref:UBA-like superfamily n=1 Tax=Hexamita inflata TaxID=28002 RepID=A0AA86QR33_9EUKA|nr:UBA-like superfamily [Hexamita inflata]